MTTSEAQKRANKKWRETHQEDYNAYMAGYRERNREKVNEYQRDYQRRRTEFWQRFWAMKKLEETTLE